ncbi:MAG: hypothetical protein ACRC4N_11710 [Gammaproteobacteria bacterium]
MSFPKDCVPCVAKHSCVCVCVCVSDLCFPGLYHNTSQELLPV